MCTWAVQETKKFVLLFQKGKSAKLALSLSWLGHSKLVGRNFCVFCFFVFLCGQKRHEKTKTLNTIAVPSFLILTNATIYDRE